MPWYVFILILFCFDSCILVASSYLKDLMMFFIQGLEINFNPVSIRVNQSSVIVSLLSMFSVPGARGHTHTTK